jgi:hypothetical protein
VAALAVLATVAAPVAADDGAIVSRAAAVGVLQTETPSTPALSAPEGGRMWHFTVPLGAWFFGMQGPVGVSGYSRDVDLSIGDVQDLKSLAGGFAFEAGYDRWTALTQVVYLRFEPDPGYVTLPDEIVFYGNPRLEWFTAELAGAYRALVRDPGPRMFVLEPLAGVRYTKMTGSVHDEQDTGLDFPERHVDWVDGFAGVRVVKAFTKNVGVTLRGDVGAGGSNLAWSAAGSAGYRFPLRKAALTLALGFKASGIDYESDNASEFKMDVTMSGPTVGFAYSF